MKQKRLENILYVFDVNPYEITQDTDAEIIKVQEESYKGFVEMNPDLANKIVRFNYHTMCVNVPEWAPYVEQEDPQEPLTFGIYGAGAADAINQIQVQNAENVVLESWTAGVDLTFPFQTDVEEGQHCVIECKEGIYDLSGQFNVTGAEYLPVRWVDQETGNTWYSTLAIVDSISIGISAAEPSAELAWWPTEATVTIGADDNVFPVLNNPHNVDVTYNASNPEYASIDQSTGVITLVSAGQTWIEAIFNGDETYAPQTASYLLTVQAAQPSTYKFVLEGSDIHQNATVKVNGETTSYTPEQLVDGVQLNDGDVIDVYPTQNTADYSLVSGATWSTDHWTATVNGANVDIWINYLGAGVNFVASWGNLVAPENVSQINIGNTSVTGNDLTDRSWTETVRAYPGSSQVQYFVSTGLPTDMEKIEVDFEYQVNGITYNDYHFAYKQTDPDTGEVFYSDAADASGNTVTNPGIWQYNNTPDSGLPWIAFTLPATDQHGNAFADNTDMKIWALVSGS